MDLVHLKDFILTYLVNEKLKLPKNYPPIVSNQEEIYKKIMGKKEVYIDIKPNKNNKYSFEFYKKTYYIDKDNKLFRKFNNNFKEIKNFMDFKLNDTKIYFNLFKLEVNAQTYFMRDLLRELGNIRNKSDYSLNKTYKDKKLKKWIENYDFNKIFNKDNPPIASILKFYLDKIENNFNLFYVVSNNTYRKCTHQIDLIGQSKNFLDAMNYHSN